jgi:hypothetical protein
LKRAVSVDMYKKSVKGKVRWMSDNVDRDTLPGGGGRINKVKSEFL